MSKSSAIGLCCGLLVAGCVNYGVDTTITPLDRVPDKILAAFVRSKQNASIQKVEVHTHHTTVVGYRVAFLHHDGALQVADFDRKGQRVHYQQPQSVMPK